MKTEHTSVQTGMDLKHDCGAAMAPELFPCRITEKDTDEEYTIPTWHCEDCNRRVIADFTDKKEAVTWMIRYLTNGNVMWGTIHIEEESVSPIQRLFGG